VATKQLKASVIIGGSISSALRNALGTTTDGLKRIGQEIANVGRRKRLLSTSIDTFGRMGKNVDTLRAQYAHLTREADRLRAAQERLASANARIDANNARRGELGGSLRNAIGVFGATAAATFFPIRSAVDFESAMLGVAKQVEGARDGTGNLTSVYFDMAQQVQRLGREIPIATDDIAAMVAAGARMGVARDALLDFTRTSAMMADAFELPAGQLADDMGKIAGLFHIPIPRVGELADAINFLDDNAISKGGDIIDVMRRMGGMAQTLRVPAKEAAALASTFLTLGSSAEVSGTASNALLRILGAATTQSKKVQAGFADIGMTARGVQSSMAKDATGTILRVLDVLNSLNEEQRIVAATRIFGAEYGDDIAKLAAGTQEYRRQLALANGEAAQGSMSREFQSRLKTTAAQWQIAKNRLSEVAVTIGSALLPAVNSLMSSIAPAIESFASWSRGNPRLIRGIIGAALALTGLRVVSLGAAYAWTLIRTPILSVLGFIARWRAGSALASLGEFGTTAGRVVGVVRTLGLAVGAVGAGSIAVVIGALIAGALLVRKYWQPISAWLDGFFDGLRASVAPLFAELGRALGPLKPAWDAIARAVSAAWNGFTRILEPLKMARAELSSTAEAGRIFGGIVGAAISLPFKLLALGINAVRSAWETLKQIIGAGVDWILQRVQPVLNLIPSFGALASRFTGNRERRTAPHLAQQLMPGSTRGRQAPSMPATGTRAAPGVSVSQQNTFHITQQPGESTEELARRIARHTRQQQAIARRGSLIDEAA